MIRLGRISWFARESWRRVADQESLERAFNLVFCRSCLFLSGEEPVLPVARASRGD